MPRLWILIFTVVLLWSGWAPKDRLTWFLEVAPALAALVLLWSTRHRFPLTPLTLWLVLVHCLILMVGGHYTYAEVPLFDWIAQWLDQSRNNYDKLGHLAQGFVPALCARELILRLKLINGRRWSAFFIICFCLALSAFYELIEWWVALASNEAADAFLGTQGYVWDTQSDMLMALIGAVLALATLGRYHDRQLARLDRYPVPLSTNAA
ncbi:hypothetical protein ADIMK_1760 [Marinobacterium lacunae]|uniref:DUF2238 domain-containing protein n=1 Tax=Marinobacterium lacunae TaxID=1232683 RepID=A0A081FZS0_9GAMM|nr:DUF2238 domain-containing protein [Marinobacterium lacunae]KEA64025.1 hypothetical protein ADIMK_1760 [Marinobacterium lacunae]MBR9885284.1 DUF2238 domain-containing protein [Oceanospirillales bacterium]